MNMEVSTLQTPAVLNDQDKGFGVIDTSGRTSQDFPDLLSLDDVEFLMDELRNCSESQVQSPKSPSSHSSEKKEDTILDPLEKIDPRQLKDEIAKGKTGEKPGLSYIALISLAIQSSPQKKMVLGDIYSWVSNNFPYFKLMDRSWRNSIRHNLSLNECFIKAGRCENGKGNYWSIHPANVVDFKRGDFRRRRARIQVRKSNEKHQRSHPQNPHLQKNQSSNCSEFAMYVPMTLLRASDATIISMFGPQVLTDRRTKEARKAKRDRRSDSESSNSEGSSNFSSPLTPASSSSSNTPPLQAAAGSEQLYYLPPTTVQHQDVSQQNLFDNTKANFTDFLCYYGDTTSQTKGENKAGTQNFYGYFNAPSLL